MSRYFWPAGLVAVIVLLVSLGSSVSTRAGEQDAPVGPVLIERTYDVRLILADPYPEWKLEPQPELSMYGWHKHANDDVKWPSWAHTYSSGQYFFKDATEVIGVFQTLGQGDEVESVKLSEYSKTDVVVRATARVHERIATTVNLLLAFMQARIHVELRKLDQQPDALVMAKPPEGTLIGTRDIFHGGLALFSDLKKTRVTWSADASWRGTVPESVDHFWGKEWGVGALLLPDGRIRVQAWHAHLTNEGTREWKTRNGIIQLPSGNWSMAPGAATVPNGGSLILDAPGGPYSITVSSDARLPNSSLEDDGASLWNPAAVLPPGDFTSLWHLGPIWQPDWGSSPSALLPLGIESRSFSAIRYPEPLSAAAVEALSDAVTDLAEDSAIVDTFMFGPVFCLQPGNPEHGGDVDDVMAAREALKKLMDELLAGHMHHQVEAMILRVPKGVAIAKGVESGKPTDAEVSALAASPGVTTAFSRKAVFATNQETDLIQLHMQNYLAGMHGWGYGDEETWFNTQVATNVTGVQVRLKVDSNGRLSANAAWRYEGAMKELKPDGALEGETLEAPAWKTVLFQLSEHVDDGRALSATQPLEDGEVAVLIVRRREVK